MKKSTKITLGIIIFFVSSLFSLIFNNYYHVNNPQTELEFFLILLGIAGICTGILLCFNGITEMNNEGKNLKND